jgi:hypothetical protein
MYRLTDLRKAKARETLDRYSAELQRRGAFEANGLECELRGIWDTGYREVKDAMIDLLRNHPEYEPLAAYFMEHSNPAGVVSEFQGPLAKLYGLSSWQHDETMDSKRARYWKTVFKRGGRSLPGEN